MKQALLSALIACAILTTSHAAEPTDLESDAIEAYQIATNWVERIRVPDQTPSVKALGVEAVHVTLRVDGLMVGQGTALPEPEGQPDAEAELMPLVARALRQAIAEWRISELAPDATPLLDLQIAHHLVPLELTELSQLPRSFVPHAQGLAVNNEGKWARIFPGNMVAANADLNDQLLRLMTAADLSLNARGVVGTDQGPPLYRFDVVHISTSARTNEPVLLYRGRELLAPVSPHDQSLALFGEQLADHVAEWQRDDGWFHGAYEPTTNTYSPPASDASAVAFACYSLARSARITGNASPSRDEAAQRGVEALLQRIGNAGFDDGMVVGRDAEPTAMTLLALLETGSPRKTERDELIAKLRELIGPDGVCRTDTTPSATSCTLETQSLVVAALAAAYEQTRDPTLLDQVRAGLEAAWSASDTSNEHRLLPWVVVAERSLSIRGEKVNAERLDALLNRLWDRQVKPWGESEKTASPDTLGGFLLDGVLIPEPTIESAEVLAGIAFAMRTGGMKDETERAQWLLRAGLAVRFLQQLTIQPQGAYYTRNPGKAIGGVSAALWDNRQPLRSNAAALFAVTELRLVMDDWKRQTEAE